MLRIKKRKAVASRRRERPGVRVLGIATSNDVAALVRRVRHGFRFSALQRLERASGLSRDSLARFVGIPVRTLARRQSEGRLLSDESDRVLRASAVFEMAVDLFEGDHAAALRWLQTPQPALGGETPLDFASTSVGAREVEHLIGRLEHGVFG